MNSTNRKFCQDLANQLKDRAEKGTVIQATLSFGKYDSKPKIEVTLECTERFYPLGEKPEDNEE